MMVMHSDSIAMAVVHCVVLCSLVTLTAQTPMQVVVPQGIESVNGSAVNMGCTSPLVDSDGVMICDECSTNLLIDGNSPVIDTSTSDWASQLVTVRKTQTDEIPFEHVLLTFGFDTAVTLTVIEMDLFLCPEWGINAQFISVYANVESNLVVTSNSLNNLLFTHYTPSQSSCGSLSTVAISLGDALTSSSYLTWHILFSSFPPSIDWVHVGEVRFLGLGNTPQVICPTPTVTSFESMTPVTSFASSVTISTPPPTTSTSSVSSTPDLVSSSPQASPSSSRVAIPAPPSSLVSSAPAVSSSHVSTPTQATSSSLPVFSSTPTHPPVSSTSPTTKPTSSRETPTRYISTPHSTKTISHPPPSPTVTSTRNLKNALDEMTAVLVAVACAGIIVLGGLVVVCCCISRKTHRSYSPGKKMIQEPSIRIKASSLNCDVDDRDRLPCATNPLTSSFPSPIHNQYNAMSIPSGDSDYEDVIPSKSNTLERGHNYSYASVMINEGKTKVHYSSSFKYDYIEMDRPIWSLRNGKELKPKKVDAPTAPLSMYVNIPIAPSPVVSPPKSKTQEDCALSEPLIEEVFFSERIDPSDFFSAAGDGLFEASGGEDSLPLVYGPVYPVPSPTPHSRPPVEISSDNVKELSEGSGMYGNAVLAFTKGLSLKDMRLSMNTNRNISIFLAIKKLRPQPSVAEKEAFDREVLFLSRLKHPNVVQFMGVCYQDPAFIMMEYMEEGDLNQFLRRYSEIVTTPSSENQIAVSILVYMASQIASGMKHLAELQFVHRDLATRKCFVGCDFTVKLADFGTNCLYEAHYYRITGNRLMPIRWMPTECLFGKFSEKTDVWAFGVTMWELFTLAQDVPYPHLSDEEVVQNALEIKHRQFPSKPQICPDPVYKLMEKCFCVDGQQRATFQEIDQSLQELK